MDKIERPTFKVAEHERYSPTEVGITHQFTNAYVRLTDAGDVEIVAGEGLAIIMHPQNRSITFVADKIKFLTKDHGGLVWNKRTFNDRATKFTEPAFYEYDPEEGIGIFRGFDDFLEEEV